MESLGHLGLPVGIQETNIDGTVWTKTPNILAGYRDLSKVQK